MLVLIYSLKNSFNSISLILNLKSVAVCKNTRNFKFLSVAHNDSITTATATATTSTTTTLLHPLRLNSPRVTCTIGVQPGHRG